MAVLSFVSMVLFALATLPAGADKAEDRHHFKFYEPRDNLDRIVGALAALDNGKPRQSPRSSRRATERQPRRRKPARGDTQQAILEVLAQHPGSSASAISAALGLKRNSTSTRLTQMAKAGLIVRSEGRGYELPGAAQPPPAGDAAG